MTRTCGNCGKTHVQRGQFDFSAPVCKECVFQWMRDLRWMYVPHDTMLRLEFGDAN